MLMELCQPETLADIQKRRKILTLVEVRYYVHQLVKGLQYLHSKKVIHRDLKLRNLMIDQDMQLKIGDFGLSAQLSSDRERRKTICGTPNYLAPELIQLAG